ncbi:hypothetical protein ACIQB5_42395 [Streptomyces sp. NPDC088560]|uniref:hypothetical protein n=1 Tax=Streptomyces sp. NPDC088560 TaxID=3365868 RepID=UPI0038172E70
MARKGGTVRDVTIGDCVELQHAIGEHQTNGCHGKHLFYQLLAGLGVFGPDAPARLKTVMLPGRLTPAALVDRHGITCTAIRDLLVDYLTERAVDVDYTTLEDMARTLAGLFWRDMEKHHPGIDSLRLDADTATAWRERVGMVRDRHGIPIRPRVNAHTVFSWVRAFYQDLARWAAEEPARWGPWVAPCPVRNSDTDHSKNRARRKAAMDQRTHTLLPALPALVKAVERQLKDAQTCLATGRETPAGALFTTPAGETLLRRAGVSSRIYADDPATGRRRDLTVMEWHWASAHATSAPRASMSTPRCIRCPVLRPDPEQRPRLEEIHANLLDRLQEAKEQGWLGEAAAIEASLAAAEQKLAAMRDLATRHTTVHLGMPDFRSSAGRHGRKL